MSKLNAMGEIWCNATHLSIGALRRIAQKMKILFHSEKPRPLGGVIVMRLCRNGYSLLLLTPVVPATRRKEIAMSRFRKLTHTLWHCQYHLVWVPKYRYRIFDGKVGDEAKICIRMFTEQSNCDVV